MDPISHEAFIKPPVPDERWYQSALIPPSFSCVVLEKSAQDFKTKRLLLTTCQTWKTNMYNVNCEDSIIYHIHHSIPPVHHHIIMYHLYTPIHNSIILYSIDIATCVVSKNTVLETSNFPWLFSRWNANLPENCSIPGWRAITPCSWWVARPLHRKWTRIEDAFFSIENGDVIKSPC